MVTLVTIETLALLLMALLVAGLLRSHAEILRRLAQLDGTQASSEAPTLDDGLPAARAQATPAFDILGETLEGDPVKVSVHGHHGTTLLAFLSTGCTSCGPFWEGLGANRTDLPLGTRVVVVTKDASHERPAALVDLIPRDVPLVMSSAAWDEYRVQGSPYFIHVDGAAGSVTGEGTARAWDQVASLLRDATHDEAVAAERGGARSTRANGSERTRRAEAELAAAGIGPGHPSLHGRSDANEGSDGPMSPDQRG